MRRAAVALLLIACTISFGAPQLRAQDGENEVEEIYVARSVRQGRVVPSDFCAPAKTGFAPGLEDQLAMRSVTTRASDGRMVGTNDKDIGSMHVCIGQAMDPTVLATYAEGQIAGVAFTGIGDCRLVRGNQPEDGLLTHRCFLVLSGLPQPYVGGFLVSSSLYSRTPFGTESSPPGYSQAAILVVRLFRRRQMQP